MSVVMKFSCVSFLFAGLLSLVASVCEMPKLRPSVAKAPPEVIPDVSPCQPDAAPKEVEASVSDLERSQPGLRAASIVEPTRQWILPDKTWRAMAESRWNFDVSLDPGREYVGVRFILPFGS